MADDMTGVRVMDKHDPNHRRGTVQSRSSGVLLGELTVIWDSGPIECGSYHPDQLQVIHGVPYNG